MALSAEVLAELAFNKYQTKMEEAHPSSVLSRTVNEVPKADGTIEYSFTEETGPIEIDKKYIMPLLLAISEAVVEHIKEHATVPNVASGAVTRTIV